MPVVDAKKKYPKWLEADSLPNQLPVKKLGRTYKLALPPLYECRKWTAQFHFGELDENGNEIYQKMIDMTKKKASNSRRMTGQSNSSDSQKSSAPSTQDSASIGLSRQTTNDLSEHPRKADPYKDSQNVTVLKSSSIDFSRPESTIFLPQYPISITQCPPSSSKYEATNANAKQEVNVKNNLFDRFKGLLKTK